MRFWEAMKALEEGKAIRCKDWGNDAFWSFSLKGNMFATLTDIFFLMKSEWELFIEPEKLLSFSEVINGLKQNKIFKRKFIKATYTIFLNRDKNDTIYVLPLLEPWRCTIEDFEATDWVQVDG